MRSVATDLADRPDYRRIPWLLDARLPGTGVRPWWVFLGLLIGGALLVRAVDLLGSPYGFFCDEASNGLDAYLLAHTLHDQHGAFLPAFVQSLGDWRGALYVYWQIPFIVLLGPTELAVRLSSAVAGAVTVGLAYAAISRVYGRTTGVATAILLALSPWHLIVSRIGFELITLPMITVLALTCLFIGLERPRVLPLAFIVASLGIYTYQPGRVFFPLISLACLIVYWKPLMRHRAAVRTGLAAAIVVQLPTLIAIRNGTFFSRLNQVATPDLTLPYRLGSLATNYLAHFQPAFLFHSSDDLLLLRASVRGFGVLYPVEAPFLVLGVAVMLWRHRRADILFLLWLALFPVATALVSGPSAFRSVAGVVVFQIAIARGAVALIDGLRWSAQHESARVRRLPQVTLAVLFVMLLVPTAQFLNAYLMDYPRYSSGWWGWQSGPRQIIAYFEAHRRQYTEELLDADVNAPEVLLRFYTVSNPDLCASCVTTNIHDPQALHDRYHPGSHQLWAVSAESLSPLVAAHVPYTVLQRLRDPAGNISWYVVATGPGSSRHQRALVP